MITFHAIVELLPKKAKKSLGVCNAKDIKNMQALANRWLIFVEKEAHCWLHRMSTTHRMHRDRIPI